MNLAELRHSFAETKKYETDNLNKLMDFSRHLYLQGHLTLHEFRVYLKNLESEGAESPIYQTK
ncbi:MULTISPECIES: YppF family protein [Bacillus]|uniref:YppF-like protein n=2 Tax=Bacillus TaxID=1386 RepID=A0A0M4FTC2_9BACI|nr:MULTISPECIES: YppF family protein [Bacillus]ALC81380.1 hypothetical protein AM592_07055 [Bacillus gobiensis]MBP1080405.1 hypothetical protein [Bacillus capparidis]MED1094262.1 YppF family protein [Bacillus capparidis]